MTIKILFIGDIVGKIGRKAVALVLPELKKQYQPDMVIANVENIAHGKGVTKKTLHQVEEAGVDFFTSGNHIFTKDNDESMQLLQDENIPLLRPANYPPGVPGAGAKLARVGVHNLLIINLLGQVFMDEQYDCPFRRVKEILDDYKGQDLAGVVVDFHAEATSEKMAMGWHLDGLVSAVIGTHTHTATADARLLPKGTAYISDVGMAGAKDSILGVDKNNILRRFLTKMPAKHEMVEAGGCLVNAVLVEIDSATRRAVKIERVERGVRVD